MGHEPVLVKEALSFLPGSGTLLDATVGLGGHTVAFLQACPEGTVIGMDRDAEILERVRGRLQEMGLESRVELHHGAFSTMADVCKDRPLDGVLFDFGVSSPQLDVAERGFSFQKDAPLDMRMDRSQGETAADLVNTVPEIELGNLLFELGGERSSRRIASAIVAERRHSRIATTGRLATIVRRAVRGRGKIDGATRTFQALRMAVNDELGEIERALDVAPDLLRPGGRLVAIAFHSGEDRVVKHALRADDRLDVLTKKVVRPSEAERRRNPRSRSSRLRAAERNEDA